MTPAPSLTKQRYAPAPCAEANTFPKGGSHHHSAHNNNNMRLPQQPPLPPALRALVLWDQWRLAAATGRVAFAGPVTPFHVAVVELLEAGRLRRECRPDVGYAYHPTERPDAYWARLAWSSAVVAAYSTVSQALVGPTPTRATGCGHGTGPVLADGALGAF